MGVHCGYSPQAPLEARTDLCIIDGLFFQNEVFTESYPVRCEYFSQLEKISKFESCIFRMY